jgi:hypothetical protein
MINQNYGGIHMLQFSLLVEALQEPSRRLAKVRFSHVEIREYWVMGPSLLISWNASRTFPIDEYEHCRPPRRSLVFFEMGEAERAKVLRDDGFLSDELEVPAEIYVESIQPSCQESQRKQGTKSKKKNRFRLLLFWCKKATGGSLLSIKL